jgi:low temperature requirement protein LtrA
MRHHTIGPHSEEGGRVTTFELFFDLVFVFSFTQVSRLMAERHDALGVLQGILVFAMLWELWVAFGWLSNQARADRGLIRVGLIVAAILIFLLATTIPHAFPEHGEGASIPFVLLACYFACRLIHSTLYLKASGDDPELRRQVLRTAFAPMLPAAVVFGIGALAGAPWQTWIWLGAFALDIVFVYATSRGGGWRVHSASYWSERFSLIVILALGESVVALGAAAVRVEIDLPLVAAIALTIVLAFAFWWAYFERMQPASEHLLESARGRERTRLATDAYTFLHLPIMAGIIVTALGIEVATSHVADAEHGMGWFGAIALAGGASLFLAGTGFYWRRISGWWPWSRMGSGVVLLAVIPAVAAAPALVALAGLTLLVIVLLVAEEALDRWWRARAAPEPVSAESEASA